MIRPPLLLDDLLRYLALIEQKINALDRGAPMAGWRLPEELNVSVASGPANGRSADGAP